MLHERLPPPNGQVALTGQSASVPQAYYPYPPQQVGAVPPEDDFNFDPIKLLWLVVHHRWLIAGFLAVGLVLGVLYTWSQTPLYRSSAKLEIVTSGARVIKELEFFSQSNSYTVYQTYLEKIRSRDLARRVAYQLNLSENSSFLQPRASFSLMNVFRKAFGISNTINLNDIAPERREAWAIGYVQGGNISSDYKKHKHNQCQLQSSGSKICSYNSKPNSEKPCRSEHRFKKPDF